MSEQAKLYTAGASKKPVNLTINKALLEKARSLNINLSALMESALVELIREKEKSNWISDNADAIDEYNKRVEKEGLFGDDVRKF